MLGYKSIIAATSFIFFGTTLIIILLSPINQVPEEQFAPDLLFCFIFIFLVRSPKQVPIISIAVISLLADFLWYRPIGLTTITTILASELLRSLLAYKEKIGFFEEYIYITIIFVSMTVLQEVIKLFCSIPSLTISHIVNYILFTLLVYPLITLFIKVIKRSKLV